MTHTLIEEGVDIEKYPDNFFSLDESHQITLGDLHGNALKFFFILVKNGIVRISEVDFYLFVEVYKSSIDGLSHDNLTFFSSILDRCTFKKAFIRLIGDEFSDRGNNDYFTLKILEKLQLHQVSIEILISNHSIEFLQACERYPEKRNFKPTMLRYDHANSLHALNEAVENSLVHADEILGFVDTFYKRHLKVISYSLNQAQSEITLYTHAPIGLNILRGLAHEFGQEYKDESIFDLIATINAINEEFQKMLLVNQVYQRLCKSNGMLDAYFIPGSDLREFPFICTIWNRNLDLIEEYRPSHWNNYELFFVHGHDSNQTAYSHVFNLDNNNELGKVVWLNEGTMTLLVSLRQFPLPALDEHATSLAIISPANETVGPIQIEHSSFVEELSPMACIDEISLSGASQEEQPKVELEPKNKFFNSKLCFFAASAGVVVSSAAFGFGFLSGIHHFIAFAILASLIALIVLAVNPYQLCDDLSLKIA